MNFQLMQDLTRISALQYSPYSSFRASDEIFSLSWTLPLRKQRRIIKYHNFLYFVSRFVQFLPNLFKLVIKKFKSRKSSEPPDILKKKNRSKIFLSPRLNQQYALNIKNLSTINSCQILEKRNYKPTSYIYSWAENSSPGAKLVLIYSSQSHLLHPSHPSPSASPP